MDSLTTQEITHLAEFGEVEAYDDMLAAMPPDLTADLGARLTHVGTASVLVIERVPILLFNRVVGLGVAEPATEEQLDAALAAGQAGGRAFGVQLAPAAQPPQLGEWLAARGFTPGDNWVKLLRGVEPPPTVPTALRISEAGPDDAAAVAVIAGVAFIMPPPIVTWLAGLVGRPGWQYYLAWAGDQLVATAALFVRGTLGWLGIAGTLPMYRGQGAQNALIAARIQAAARQGCRWLVTETGEETPTHPNSSYHNLVRLGFQAVYLRRNYLR